VWSAENPVDAWPAQGLHEPAEQLAAAGHGGGLPTNPESPPGGMVGGHDEQATVRADQLTAAARPPPVRDARRPADPGLRELREPRSGEHRCLPRLAGRHDAIPACRWEPADASRWRTSSSVGMAVEHSSRDATMAPAT